MSADLELVAKRYRPDPADRPRKCSSSGDDLGLGS
jgi:hypothetical protein